MKNFYKSLMLLGICFYGLACFAQNQTPKTVITPKEWNERKQIGTITPDMTLRDANLTPQVNTQTYHPVRHASQMKREKSSNACTCFQQIDTCSTDSCWHVVPMLSGNTTAFAPYWGSDDDSDTLLNLPFTFGFYGVGYTSC